MKSLLTYIVSFVSAISLYASHAHGGSVTYSDNAGPIHSADYDETISVPQFDTSLGTLERVDIEIQGVWHSHLTGQHPDIELFGDAFFFQGFLPFTPNGGGSMPLSVSQRTEESSTTTTMSTDTHPELDINAFVGTGNVEVEIIGTCRVNDLTHTLPPPWINLTADCSFTVTYTYTP